MKNRAALTAALRAVIEDAERARAVGAAAREHVVAGYSRELRINRLEALYRTIIDAKLQHVS
jgi:glycosyltransferase involved in cell wall biosynthesis